VPLGAMLGATAADPGPNSARLMDAATARRQFVLHPHGLNMSGRWTYLDE
jgi:hypothetical protein